MKRKAEAKQSVIKRKKKINIWRYLGMTEAAPSSGLISVDYNALRRQATHPHEKRAAEGRDT